VAEAARRAASRWALDEVLAVLPAARPSGLDIQPQAGVGGTSALPQASPAGRSQMLVDLTDGLRPLFRGGKKVAELYPQWAPACKGHLISAIAGGQWPQARKAKLAGCKADGLCQLCRRESGTLLHRHTCPVIMPAGGWQPFPPRAAQIMGGLNATRRAILTTRAVMVVSIPVPSAQVASEGWVWHSEPPDVADVDLVWVIDGSRKHAEVWETATTGCGVAVIRKDGTLVAYAHATPPPWARTAAAAEAWALSLVVELCPFIPSVLTDCKAVVDAAWAGVYAATAASRPTARIWRRISHCVNGDFGQLRRRIVWMPAHTACEAVGARRKSDGTAVQVTEWRANQLADALAKLGAGSSEYRAKVGQLIADARTALQCSAARLGEVTRAANNHREQVACADGSLKWVTRRDSAAKPPAASAATLRPAQPEPPRQGSAAAPTARAALQRPAPTVPPAAAAAAEAALGEQSSSDSGLGVARPARAPDRRRRARARADRLFLDRAVHERTEALRPRQGPTAGDRLEALRARVMGRFRSSAD